MVHMSNAYTTVGKTRLKVYAAIVLIDFIIIALSARVNQFQEFFFMADLFPLGLSITTLILFSILLLLDFSHHNSFTARPPFELAFLTVLSIFWLAFNSFSTSRWRFIPLACGSIPSEYSDEISWCRNLQALKSFVWIEWVMLFLFTIFTMQFVIREHNRGNKHIWTMPLTRYSSHQSIKPSSTNEKRFRTSSFWAGNQSFNYNEMQ